MKVIATAFVLDHFAECQKLEITFEQIHNQEFFKKKSS